MSRQHTVAREKTVCAYCSNETVAAEVGGVRPGRGKRNSLPHLLSPDGATVFTGHRWMPATCEIVFFNFSLTFCTRLEE